MEKHRAYYELLERLKKPGCPVCSGLRQSLRSYLDSYLYESVTDREGWDRLTLSRGYCPRHSQMLEGFSDGLAVSLFYRHILRLELGDLRPGQPGSKGLLGKLFAAPAKAQSGPCPACGHEAEVEAGLLRLFGQACSEAEFWAAWKGREAKPGESLCLSHLRGALAAAGERGAELLELETGRGQALAAELDEYVRKSDHTCDEKFGPEGDAWRRVLAWFRGPASR